TVPAGPRQPTLTIGSAAAGRLPAVGLSSASDGQGLDATEIRRLAALHPAHPRGDLGLDRPGWEGSLRQASDEAQALGVPLEVALFVDDAAEEQLAALRSELEQVKPSVVRWLVLHRADHATSSTAPRWVSLARAALRDSCPGARFGI